MLEEKSINTHRCFCFMLIFAQCCGLLPICEITKQNCSFLNFKWRAKRTIYSITFAIFAAINVVFQIIKMVQLEHVLFADFGKVN